MLFGCWVVVLLGCCAFGCYVFGVLGSWTVALLGCWFLVLLGSFAILLFAVWFLMGCYAVGFLCCCFVPLYQSSYQVNCDW